MMTNEKQMMKWDTHPQSAFPPENMQKSKLIDGNQQRMLRGARSPCAYPGIDVRLKLHGEQQKTNKKFLPSTSS